MSEEEGIVLTPYNEKIEEELSELVKKMRKSKTEAKLKAMEAQLAAAKASEYHDELWEYIGETWPQTKEGGWKIDPEKLEITSREDNDCDFNECMECDKKDGCAGFIIALLKKASGQGD